MADGEKIDLKKAVTSPFTGLYWVKTIMFGLGLACLFFVGYAVYKAYFKKPEPAQHITVEEGGTVTIKNQEVRRKALIPFVEVYADQRHDMDLGTGIRAGVRFEW